MPKNETDGKVADVIEWVPGGPKKLENSISYIAQMSIRGSNRSPKITTLKLLRFVRKAMDVRSELMQKLSTAGKAKRKTLIAEFAKNETGWRKEISLIITGTHEHAVMLRDIYIRSLIDESASILLHQHISDEELFADDVSDKESPKSEKAVRKPGKPVGADIVSRTLKVRNDKMAVVG